MLRRVVLRRLPPLREPELRVLRVLRVPLLRERVDAAFLAAVLRLLAARLRVAAAFFAAADRVDVPRPGTRFSRSLSTALRSATVRRSVSGARELAAFCAVARSRATRLRKPLLRNSLNNC